MVAIEHLLHPKLDYRNSEYVCFYFLTAKLEVTSGFSDPPQRTWVKRLVSFSACFRVWVRLP